MTTARNPRDIKKIELRLPLDLNERVQALADRDGTPFHPALVRVIRVGLNAEEAMDEDVQRLMPVLAPAIRQAIRAERRDGGDDDADR